MDQELRDLRQELAARERGRGLHYPAELRDHVTAWARHRLKGGGAVQAVAAELGIRRETLRRWLRARPVAAALVPVEVAADLGSRAGLSVVLPSGFRIDGLTVDEAVAVLQRLA